jgi:hypothetical protein
MPTFPARQNINLLSQSLTLSLVPGVNSYVGIGITGTFVGTLTVTASQDGQNFVLVPIQNYPWVEGAATVNPLVQASGVANKSIVLPAGNWLAVKVTMTAYTSGTATVAMAASQDGSYVNAYSANNILWQTSTATAAGNTLTIAAATNHGWKVSKLIVTFGSTPTTGQVTIQDGANNLQIIDLPLTAGSNDLSTYLAGIASTPGNNLVISMPSGGAGVRSDINVLAEAA